MDPSATILSKELGKDLFLYLKVPLDVRGLEQQNWNNPNPYKNANLRPKHYLKHIV